MLKNNENEVIPRFVGTFVIDTFDSESLIDADENVFSKMFVSCSAASFR